MEKSENELINLLNTYREESLEFKEKYFSSLDRTKELEAELQQSHDRERVLREALDKLIERTTREFNILKFSHSKGSEVLLSGYRLQDAVKFAREALEASK